ncbi:MAG: type II secretion system F family protein [Chloroflexota bacterium]|nr:type II secretion system F family protein [Chloroflexota bacterium]
MSYKYFAYTRAGQRVQGIIDVDSEEMAEKALWGSDYIIVNLKQVRKGPSLNLAKLMPTFFGVKIRDLIVFSRQLATLVESGITIVAALQMLRDLVDSRALKTALAEIIRDVQEGESLSASIEKHPLVFPFIYSRLVRVAERTGNMGSILRQLAAYLEKRESLTSKLKGAMAYPAFILLLAVGVVFLMLTTTLPAMLGLFAEFEAQLPLPTRILIAVTDFVMAYKTNLMAGIFLTVMLIALYVRTPIGRRQFHLLLLKLPLIGTINLQGNISRFCHTMSMLLKAGLPMTEIMDLVSRIMGNVILRNAFQEVQEGVLEGRGLSEPIAEHKVFPNLLVQMVRVGEETGSLDSNLETLAVFYEEQADRKIKILTDWMEPALMLFVGAVVGFIAVAVIMPMYSLMGQMQSSF